jgi:TatD DNase family protein
MLVDSHAHLDDARFDPDRDEAIRRAWEAGVRGILTIGNGSGPDDMGCGLPLARAHPWIYTTVGVHPHDAGRAESRHFKLMEELARDPNVLAIGEAGLDYHYDNSPRPVQREVFRAQLELANRVDLPVVIHTRDADPDTIALLGETPPARGVVHCFTGGADLMEYALGLGLMISISGILTFPRSEGLRELVRRVPDDRLLVETDAPYLAPAPHRGRRNEPAFVHRTAEALAGLRGVSPERLAGQTAANFERLFGVAL